MTTDSALRSLLAQVLSWEDAHAGFEAAVEGLPAPLRGTAPQGLPYSPWQMLEHLRITQHDILDFCVNPGYQEMAWPADYWPAAAAPPSPDAWQASVDSFLQDRDALKQLAMDPALDLAAPIPHGNGQTYLRELFLVADHSAYHIGQLVLIRRLLGSWK